MTPAEKLENSVILNWIIVVLGFIAIIWYFVRMARSGASFSLDLNMVNFIFLFVSMALYGKPIKTVRAVNEVAAGAAGVILQFPFYAGIAGMMVYTGGSTGTSIAKVVSDFFISISNTTTFPIFVWLSAGIVNFFVPSGGGQWAVQAPLVLPAAVSMGVPIGKAAMSIAWGDCWTNLIQPFWALPLLAVAKLGAKDIMGYCIVCLIVLGVIMAIGMLIPPPAVAALLLLA
jgi:short-chain fatty acids transporter